MLRQSWMRSTARYISAGVQAQASAATITNQNSQPVSRRVSGWRGTAGAALASYGTGAAATCAPSAAMRPSVRARLDCRELGDHALHLVLTSGLFVLDKCCHTAAERVGAGLLFQFVELGELSLDDGGLLRLLLVGELGVGFDLEKVLVGFKLAGRKQLVVGRGMKRRPDEVCEDIPGRLDFCFGANMAVAHQGCVELGLDGWIELLAPHQRIERSERRRPDHLYLFPGIRCSSSYA